MEGYKTAKIFRTLFLAFVPFKDDKLESEMLKDVAHADIAKTDDEEVDPIYDDYYDVSVERK